MHDGDADRSLVDSVVAAIADQAPVDWQQARRAGLAAGDQELVDQLKVIAAIAGSGTAATPRPSQGPLRRAAGPAFALVVALGAAKVLVGLLHAGTLLRAPANAPLGRPQLALVALFGVAGLLLLLGGAADRRVRPLGALFTIIASAFVDPLLHGASAELAQPWRLALDAPPEAFLALALWLFVASFPAEAPGPVEQRVADAFVSLSAALGTLLFGANVLLAAGARPQGPLAALSLLDRQVAARLFWPLLAGVAAPAIPYLVWKARLESIEARRRVSLFIAALVFGLTPMLLAVLAAPLVPALADPARRQVVGAVLYAALLSLVPTTVYTVAVQRVMKVDLIVHKAMQHALARYAVWLLSLGPPAWLLVQLYLRRDGTVRELLGARGSLGLLLLSLLGFVTLTYRQHLLDAVDRWFFRHPTDYVEALARLERAFRGARSIREITALLADEVDRAMHPRTVAALVVSDDGERLVSLAGVSRPLDASSALVELLRATSTPVQFDAGAEGPIARLLPPEDRAWLAESGFRLLAPLFGSSGALLGLLAVAESRSGLPYTQKQRAFLLAIGGQAAVLLENLLLRSRTREALASRARPVDWSNEPGAGCPACARVWPASTHACACGATTVPAALPLVVNGKYRVERLLGRGGMGVVYLAVDMALNRRVALKTLPGTARDSAARLQLEARAMAWVLHPNLAMIFGLESCRETPLLVVEYLEGGTLEARLRAGPLSISAVIDLGVVLADALDRMHASGILHRDIKPSNIGYTRDGLPKLLDFGLAALLEREPGDAPATGDASALDAATALAPRAAPGTVAGTPLYLAPEALEGGPPQPSFDLWSLNLVLFEAVAGRPAVSGRDADEALAAIRGFRVPDVRQFRPTCPLDLASFFQEALSSSPARRPPSAAALRERLQRLRADLRPLET